MKRRTLLKITGAGAAGLAVAAAGGAWWLSGPAPPVAVFASLADARRWIDRLVAGNARATEGWPVAQVLEHCAQSIEYSMHGYPEAKPAWFQQSAGRLAFATFDRRGRMHHDLAEPIPGAPALSATDLPASAERLELALTAFESHAGAWAPHFAYGDLDKRQYERAHLMHLAEHAQRITVG